MIRNEFFENLANSERIQTSILNPLEKKALIWMAERLPSWVTSDMLTYGLLGPTEFWLLVVLLNTVWYFVEPLHTFAYYVELGPLKGDVLSLDVAGFVVFAVLLVLYLQSFVTDLRYFAKLDPLKRREA